MPTKNSKSKVRLNLELSSQVNENLVNLKERTDSASLAEVLRKSITLFDLVTTAQQGGGSVVLRHSDGREEVIKFL
jgi:hypothetical protein